MAPCSCSLFDRIGKAGDKLMLVQVLAAEASVERFNEGIVIGLLGREKSSVDPLHDIDQRSRSRLTNSDF
jgi:hypothetical protein